MINTELHNILMVSLISQLCCFIRKQDPVSLAKTHPQQFRQSLDYCPIHNRMGVGMSEIIPGLFVGNIRDARDQEALHNNRITHIVSIHDHAKVPLPHFEYLTLNSADSPDANITQFFHKAIDFIHECRTNQGSVLIHCMAGVSRSVTIAVAYLMTVTDHSWRECIQAAKQAREVANPNLGFQKQLQIFENTELEEVRKRIRQRYPDTLRDLDNAAIQQLLDKCNHKPGSSKNDEELYPLAYNAYTPPSLGQLPP